MLNERLQKLEDELNVLIELQAAAAAANRTRQDAAGQHQTEAAGNGRQVNTFHRVRFCILTYC